MLVKADEMNMAKHGEWMAGFRWDENVWGSSWAGMGACVAAYVVSVGVGKVLLLQRSKPVALGPLPALYHLSLLLLSCITFFGCLLSARLEIRETRWIWRRSKTDLEWLLCFPVGMRTTGRVFFWTYILYITKYFEFLGTLILILQKRSPSTRHVRKHAIMVLSCFLQLQFCQSLQIIMLLFSTIFSMVMHLYFFLFYFGEASPLYRKMIYICKITRWMTTSLASLGLLTLHLTTKEGCNGMGSWLFITLLNASLILLTSRLDQKHKMHQTSQFS